MKNKEAYKWILQHQRLFTFNCDDIDCSSATNQALKALKKQIPKRPKVNKEDSFQWFCPECGSIIGTDRQEVETNYCRDCGQRIDWGE